jgi:hypothetical protein
MQSTQKSGLGLLSNHSNGQWTGHSLQTLTLDASNDGIRYTPVGAGIRIDDTSGDSEILITQIQSEQAIFNSLNSLQTQGETIGTASAKLYEDGVPYAWNPANPNGGQGFLRQTVRTTRACARRTGKQRDTAKTIALCADSMPGRGRKRFSKSLHTVSKACHPLLEIPGLALLA